MHALQIYIDEYLHTHVYTYTQAFKHTVLDAQVWVGNLSSSTTEEDLKVEFRVCGPVRSVEIVQDRMTGGCSCQATETSYASTCMCLNACISRMRACALCNPLAQDIHTCV
jgi:hypothetical protein